MTRRRTQGSILIETLVAAAILSLMLGLVYRAMADGAVSATQLAERRNALLLAQSQLAQAGSALPLQPGDTEGRSDDLLWKLSVAPYEDIRATSNAGRLQQITVTVSKPGNPAPLAQLSTLRLAPDF